MNNFHFTANVLYDDPNRVKNVLALQKNLKIKIFFNKALNWRNKKDWFLINLLLKKNKIKNNINKKKPGEVAIWASNIKNYIHFIKNTKKKYLVIFEDDIKISKDFFKIFYFLKKRFNSFSVGRYFECVCYNRKTVKNILNSIKKNGINKAIDVYCWRNNFVKHIKNKNISQDRGKIPSKKR